MFQIESGVAVPPVSRVGAKGQSKYPFAQMHLGNSFMVPTVDGAKEKTLARLRGAAQNYVKSVEVTVKFTVRKVDGGVRCWRTA